LSTYKLQPCKNFRQSVAWNSLHRKSFTRLVSCMKQAPQKIHLQGCGRFSSKVMTWMLSFAFTSLSTVLKLCWSDAWCNNLATQAIYQLLWFWHSETTIIILKLFNDYNSKTNTFYNFLFKHYYIKVAPLAEPTVSNIPTSNILFCFCHTLVYLYPVHCQ